MTDPPARLGGSDDREHVRAEHPQVRTSTRDREELRRRLAVWLAGKVDDPHLGTLEVPATNGVSSETLLFDASYRHGGERRSLRCALRLSPDEAAAPVFPVYDLGRQFRVMRLVGRHSSVPVPPTLWLEPDEGPLGAPFFVMERVDGVVPPDVMPYTFGSWLSEASAEDRARLQSSAVGLLAQIHGMGVAPKEIAFLRPPRPGASALRRHVADLVAYYEWVVADGMRSALIERALAWLFDHWPAHEGPEVVSWGDARIGNVIFRDFEPVAVLDWEMASLAPAEVDLAWMIYLHRFLDDIALSAGLEGMGRFMHIDDAATTYESLSGHTPSDLDFYTLYAALRHAVVMSRVARRQVLFGEIAMPEDPDDLIMHRVSLEQMLAGTYWRQF